MLFNSELDESAKTENPRPEKSCEDAASDKYSLSIILHMSEDNLDEPESTEIYLTSREIRHCAYLSKNTPPLYTTDRSTGKFRDIRSICYPRTKWERIQRAHSADPLLRGLGLVKLDEENLKAEQNGSI